MSSFKLISNVFKESRLPNPWIKINAGQTSNQLKLYCFHYAGSGANIYNRWIQEFKDVADVCPIQLPGRWERHLEKAFTDMDLLIEAMQNSIKDEIKGPYAVLGYSLGALVGFEWIRSLRKLGKDLPQHFFALARPGPQVPRTLPAIVKLDDDQFLKEMQRNYGGVPEVFFLDEEIRNLFLPILRADMEIIETYKFREELPLQVPITAIRGTEDTSLTAEDLQAWSKVTSEEFRAVEIKCGHFYSQTAEAELIKLIKSSLARS